MQSHMMLLRSALVSRNTAISPHRQRSNSDGDNSGELFARWRTRYRQKAETPSEATPGRPVARKPD